MKVQDPGNMICRQERSKGGFEVVIKKPQDCSYASACERRRMEGSTRDVSRGKVKPREHMMDTLRAACGNSRLRRRMLLLKCFLQTLRC